MARVVFTGKVDHRFAWIGNDAEGSVDLFTELAAIIGAATSTSAVSTIGKLTARSAGVSRTAGEGHEIYRIEKS